ncbi:serine/threonine-protein kinase [Sphingomonas sp. LR61]|uniref:serine/threonine-protein kinase n=1 Tax=Sphingomonas sp. LR61 TaxID=3050234 RepID=UPI002FE0ED7F
MKLIGTGGMGTVYEARDEHTYRAVAVKLFATPDKMTTADRVRQEREIRLLSMLSHPGLIPLYDAGTHDFPDGPHRFIVMELIADTTLLRRLSEGALHNYEVADLGAQLADALAYVHSRGIVHRDVKPANILISDEGLVRLRPDREADRLRCRALRRRLAPDERRHDHRHGGVPEPRAGRG